MPDTLSQTPTPAPSENKLEITIRRATPEDAETLGALSTALFVETFMQDLNVGYPAGDLARFLDDLHSPAAYARMLADPAMALWLAEDRDGRAVAFASAGPCKLPVPDARPEDGQLYRFYLARPAQGSGLARRLMGTVLDWLDADRRAVWLGVWSGNLRAQRFYARYGFEKTAEFDEPVGQTVDLEYAFRRAAGAI